MRGSLVALGGLSTLGTAFVATSHCCERLNALAAVGLAEPGCLGLSQHRVAFMIASLASLLFTTGYSLYGGASDSAADAGRIGWARTAGLSVLASITGLLLFVIP